jgi:alanine dehydrogenase
MTILLSNEEIAEILTMPETIAVLEEAYVELAEGRGVTRRRSDILTPTEREDATYSLKSMDGVIPKLGVGAVRINSDIVTWPEVEGSKRRKKVPAAPNQRYTGLVLLFSSITGEPLAIFPDGVVQRMRVGATSGLGAKYMARQDAATVGILGSGWQAGTQLTAITAVRKIKTIKCFSPNRQNRERFCRDMSKQLGVEVVPVTSPKDVFAGVDIAMCATSSIEHVFFEEFMEPGMHVSSIKMPEVDQAVLEAADKVGVHWHFGTPEIVVPENHEAVEKQQGAGFKVEEGFDFSKALNLPAMINGDVAGRDSDDEVTCFLNNLGLGYQFAAVGSLVYKKAKALKVGNDLPTDWFTEDVHP